MVHLCETFLTPELLCKLMRYDLAFFPVIQLYILTSLSKMDISQ